MSDSVSSRLIVQANCDPVRPGLRQRARTIEVPGGATTSTRIRCGGRREPWSAGFESSVQPPDGAGAFPYELRRIDRRSWRAAAFGEGRGGAFTAYILCGDPR